MANKLDTTLPIFLGATAAREGTVVDHIRKAVTTLDSGQGVAYADLEAYLLANYTPAKSKNYDSSFIKSYVRDAVNKYGFLTQVDGGHVYAVDTAPQAAAKPRKAPAAPKVSKSTEEMRSVLRFILEAGEVSGPDDVLNTNITVEDLVADLNRRKNWIELRLESAVAAGLATLTVEDGRNMVYLTAEGYNAVADSTETMEAAPAAEVGAEEPSAEAEPEAPTQAAAEEEAPLEVDLEQEPADALTE